MRVVLQQYPPLAMPLRELEVGLKGMYAAKPPQNEVDFINFVGDVLEAMKETIDSNDWQILEKAMGDVLRVGEKADPALRAHKDWPKLGQIIEHNRTLGAINLEDPRLGRK